MLNGAKQFAADRKKKPSVEEWREMRQRTQYALDALLESHHGGSDHETHFAMGQVQQAEKIKVLSTKFLNVLDALFSSPPSEVPRRLLVAQSLFDEIFKNHLATLHSAHQQQFSAMKNEAHNLKQRIDYLFFGQTAFLIIVLTVALVFSEKILIKGYLRTRDESLIDGLTRARNRRHLETVTQAEATNLVEQGTPFSVILLDLDHFKRINDQWGHQAGDEVLRTVAAIIQGRLRKSDTFVRYGGEEFLILLPGAEKTVAVDIVENIRENIGKHAFVFGGEERTLHVTTSAGIAAFPADGIEDFQRLQKLADSRLYLAKQTGRNRCVDTDRSVVS
jgi:diguanylate cyclase (GGDEF)-like protein